MKISELSERSGVPLPTIKFYIREGLVPPGAHTAKNQATYSEAHLERLDLVRTLKDDAGLPLATIADIMASVEKAGDNVIDAALSALSRGAEIDERSAAYKAARAKLVEITKSTNWKLSPADAPVRDVTAALMKIQRAFPVLTPESIQIYVDIAQRIAEHEIPDTWDPEGTPMPSLKYAILGTYLFEPFILALRRVAHWERSHAIEGARKAGLVGARAKGKGKDKPKTKAKR